MRLADELDAYHASWTARADPAVLKLMADNNASLSGLARRALGQGDSFPRLSLPDQSGRPVDLAALADAAPLVVTFYRGGWCPYCNIELRAYQAAQARIEHLGARLIAVSPEKPDHSLTTAQKNALSFTVLSDGEGRLAEALGIRFELTDEIKALYRSFDIDLEAQNGDGRWSLPIPATYVVEKGGRIAAAHVDPDYRMRMEPEEAIGVLERL